jgi:hypothetical protein
MEQFVRLVTMLEKALDDNGLPFISSVGKTRFGYYVEKPFHKASLLYISYEQPTSLRLRLPKGRYDQKQAEALGGKKSPRGWYFELDLGNPTSPFFSLAGQEQLDAISAFIKQSVEKATACIIPPISPPTP